MEGSINEEKTNELFDDEIDQNYSINNCNNTTTLAIEYGMGSNICAICSEKSKLGEMHEKFLEEFQDSFEIISSNSSEEEKYCMYLINGIDKFLHFLESHVCGVNGISGNDDSSNNSSINSSINSNKTSKLTPSELLKQKIKILGLNVAASKTYKPNFLEDYEVELKGNYIQLAILAIDFLNRNSDDCFLEAMVEGLAPNCFVGPMGELKEEKTFISHSELYPYLLINVNSPTDFKRITGNTIGFFTFAGLAKLTVGTSDANEALELARNGDNSSIDMTVADIYGSEGYQNLGLPPNLIASSFGKLKSKKCDEVKKEDVCKSLMTLVSLNTVAVGYLVAGLEKLEKIVLIGTNMHAAEIHNLTEAVLTFLEKEEHKVNLFFPKHSAFLGVLGLLLEDIDKNNKNKKKEMSEESKHENK